MRSRLKAFRVLRKERQTDIASALGVSRATYSHIEGGECDGSMKFWRKFQQVYGVSDEEMYALMKLDEDSPF